MKEKNRVAGLKCCYLISERVDSSWKTLTLAQTNERMIQYLSVCFGDPVVFVNLLDRSIHKKIVGFLKLFYLRFVTYPLGNNMLHSHKEKNFDILEEISRYLKKQFTKLNFTFQCDSRALPSSC